jgi:hypothetical protein
LKLKFLSGSKNTKKHFFSPCNFSPEQYLDQGSVKTTPPPPLLTKQQVDVDNQLQFFW